MGNSPSTEAVVRNLLRLGNLESNCDVVQRLLSLGSLPTSEDCYDGLVKLVNSLSLEASAPFLLSLDDWVDSGEAFRDLLTLEDLIEHIGPVPPEPEEVEEPAPTFRMRLGAKIELGDVTPHNIKQLKRLNQVVFPVSYNDKFYKDVLEAGELAKLAYYNDIVVGAVCCRIDTSENARRLYIMTLGCLRPYRRLGIGTMMVEHVLNYVQKEANFDSVFLHVQVNNESAIQFYRKFGFEIVETKEHYYKRIEPADAHVLQKTLRTRPNNTASSPSQPQANGDHNPQHNHNHHNHLVHHNGSNQSIQEDEKRDREKQA